MKFAIIETGGKQYKIEPQKTIKTEKLIGENDKVVFEKVLLIVDDDGQVKTGHPYLEGVKVEGEIVESGKDKKIVVFKYKSKKRYHVKRGHRQPYSKIKISN
ncbi:MAG TPA: 50S ribosomal protein L21 [Candidatus Portnoybacteria bacterium]|nr:50S ribosomal protein L21 [Candidatus Portnoybacteria bacterium]